MSEDSTSGVMVFPVSLDEYLHLVLSLKLFRQTSRLGVDYAAPHSPATLLICHWKGQGQEGDDDDDDDKYADDTEGEGRSSTAQSPVKLGRDREEEDGPVCTYARAVPRFGLEHQTKQQSGTRDRRRPTVQVQ